MVFVIPTYVIKPTVIIAFLISSQWLYAQLNDSVPQKPTQDKIKKGWNFGVLPVLAFDTDLGFKYGGLTNLYYYGDGSIYPRYKHSLYFEWTRTTKGGGVNQFIYDSEYLIPKIRVTAEASLLTEKTLDFYGFNGYEAYYNPGYADPDEAAYISRVFYKYDRKLTRLKLDLQGNIRGRELRWFAGFTHFNNKVQTVDIDHLNKGKSGSDILPDTALLYDNFVEWGIIPNDQKSGGITNMLTLGVVYDTRDNEPNPMKGIWSEVLLLSCPSFLGSDVGYNKISLTHRQYFTLKKEMLNFAYRLSYQARISGTVPFYMLPYVYDSKQMRDGLGGAKTIRGILRNRIVGEDFIFGNAELRWKFMKRTIINQNFYFALMCFTDFGKVTKGYKMNTSNPETIAYLAKGSEESLHVSYGGGLFIVMNQNFVMAATYGMAANKKDGNNGLYLGLDFLF
ncbi:MAG TPA: BamA/TamA family outer membrane protein [Bacteroidales bacterium]|nr:BamA/TamA family outer membrane protein [Bacteroidales bacterium]